MRSGDEKRGCPEYNGDSDEELRWLTLHPTASTQDETMADIVCANCKVQPATGHCDMCRVVFYCSGQCAVADWDNGHAEMCDGQADELGCAMCGITGCELRPCGGCGTVSYCSQACLTEHYYAAHYATCSKALRNCYYCGNGERRWQCKGCKKACYCNQACAALHWAAGHQEACGTDTNSPTLAALVAITQRARAGRVPAPCYTCGADNVKLRCSACHKATYCNDECASTHWYTGHSTTCNGPINNPTPDAMVIITQRVLQQPSSGTAGQQGKLHNGPGKVDSRGGATRSYPSF